MNNKTEPQYAAGGKEDNINYKEHITYPKGYIKNVYKKTNNNNYRIIGITFLCIIITASIIYLAWPDIWTLLK